MCLLTTPGISSPQKPRCLVRAAARRSLCLAEFLCGAVAMCPPTPSGIPASQMPLYPVPAAVVEIYGKSALPSTTAVSSAHLPSRLFPAYLAYPPPRSTPHIGSGVFSLRDGWRRWRRPCLLHRPDSGTVPAEGYRLACGSCRSFTPLCLEKGGSVVQSNSGVRGIDVYIDGLVGCLKSPAGA